MGLFAHRDAKVTTRRLLRPRAGIIVVGAAAALATLHGSTGGVRAPGGFGTSSGVSVPLPVYTVEATSGSHHATISNLPITPLGIIDVPTPIDVTGDALPDLLVSVDLVNIRGLFPNQPGSGQLLAPTLRIARVLPGAPLQAPALPLRIDAVLTLVDTSANTTKIRLGYDTGAGGSAPPAFSIVAGGLTQLFNPLQAQVVATGYEGPLTVLAGIQSSTSRVDADVRFAPLPTGLTFSYGSDAAGQHFGIQHGGPVGAPNNDVDVTATVNTTGASPSSIVAHLDRLPRNVAMTLQPGAGDGSGGFDYTATVPPGRLPDLAAHYQGTGPGSLPLVADLNVIGLPSEVHGAWQVAPDKPASIHLAAPNEPVGAIDATVDMAPGHDPVVRHLAGQHEYLSLQEGATAERLITGHLDGLRLVDFAENSGGFTGHFQATTAQPLEVHADLASVGSEKWAVGATSTVNPLPRDVTVALAAAGSDQLAQPLTLTYNASDTVNVTGHAELRSGSGGTCGTDHTICADLSVLGIPGQIQARLSRVTGSGSTQAETRLAIDTQSRAGASPPTIIAAATVGTSSTPIVAHAEAASIPPRLRFRAVDGANGTTSVAQFNACDENYATHQCVPGTEVPVGALTFGIKDFLDRPADLGVPVLDPNANALAVTGRGEPGGTVAFDAEAQVKAVSEFDYVNDQVFGIRTKVGGSAPLKAAVDLVGITGPDSNPLDVHASTLVQHVPATFDFCLQQDGEPLQATPIHPATTNCQDPAPFGKDIHLTTSPLSVSYVAAAPIDLIQTDASIVDHGATAAVADDRQLTAHLKVTDLPAQATFRLLSPQDGTIRAVYDTGVPPPPTTPPAPPTDLTFSASRADADLVCGDARVPAKNQQVTCVSGEVKGLPNHATLTVLPDQPTNNFDVNTTTPIGVPNLEFSMVKGVVDNGIPKADALYASLSIPTLPTDVSGTLHTSPVDVLLTATPPVASIDASVQNFVGADPLPQQPPAARTTIPALTDPDTFTVFQVGDALRAKAHLTNLVSGGYEEGSNGVKVVNVGFGQGKSVRAYVDLNDGTSDTIGDVSLAQVPSTLTLCFRGAPESGGTNLGTFCEGSTADKAAFELSAGSHPATQRMDVYSYIRSASHNGADLVTGRADLLDMPDVVQGEMGSGGALDVSGFSRVKLPKPHLAPAGIGRIDAHIATFDIADTSYPVPPFSTPAVAQDPFPVPTAGGQQVGVAADAKDFEARVVLGPPTLGASGSRLQHIAMSPNPCAAPTGSSDYPEYPAVASGATTDPYSCVRADFQQTSSSPDPLALSMAIDKGSRIVLRNAALDDVPQWFQVSLSSLDGKTQAPASQPFLARCPTGGTDQPAAGTCVPPTLRFDSAHSNGDLSGLFELGTPEQLAKLAGIQARAVDLPPLDARPDASGWADWSNGGADPHGVRAALTTLDDDSQAGRVGFRIAVPDELTFDPLEKWSTSQADDTNNYNALNLTLHYAAKVNHLVVDSLGRVAAVIQDKDGSQLVLSDGAERTIAKPDGTSYPLPNGIPGELDATAYIRNNKQVGRMYAQIDGTVNRETALRLRIMPATTDESTTPIADLSLINLPSPASIQADGPSFRIQAELLGPPKKAHEVTTNSGDDCPSWYGAGSCTKTDVQVNKVGAVLDFQPQRPGHSDPPARLLRAVARYDQAQGFQVQAFKDIAGVAADGSTDPSALISGFMFVDIDPLNVSWTDRLAIFGVNADFYSNLHLEVVLDRVSDVAMRAGGNHINIVNTPHNLAEGNAWIMPIINLKFLYAGLGVDIGPVHIDAIGVDFVDLPSGPVNNKFESCSGVDAPTDSTGISGSTTAPIPVDNELGNLFAPNPFPGLSFQPNAMRVPANGGPLDVVALPDDQSDGRFVINTLDIPIPLPFSGGWLANIFDGQTCSISVKDVALIGDPHELHPANSLGTEAPPVPDAVVDNSTPGPVVPVHAGNLTVNAADPPQYVCGIREYGDVEVYGTLNVSATATDACPAALAGELAIRATTVHVHPGGQILGAASGASGVCCSLGIVADTITVDGPSGSLPGGVVTAFAGPLTMDAANTVTISPGAHVSGDFANWTANGAANPADTGNLPIFGSGGGGAHGGKGGATDINQPQGNSGGTPYGDKLPGDIGTEGGQRGDVGGGNNQDSPATAGNSFGSGAGGGAVRITGTTLSIGGAVTANGRDGGNHCDANPTKGFGSGAGAGGGIVIAGSVVTLDGSQVTADGGSGGDGVRPGGGSGGGGGGGGIIKVLAPLFNGTYPATPHGGFGGNDLADPKSDRCSITNKEVKGDPGGDGVLVKNAGSQSTALPLDGFWHTELPPGQSARNLTLRFRAAGGPDPTTTFTVYACGAYLPPSFAQQHINGDNNKGLVGPPQPRDFATEMLLDLAGLNHQDKDHPCGGKSPLGSEHITTNPTAFDPTHPDAGGTMNVNLNQHCAGLDHQCPDGFWGIYTVIVTDGGQLEINPVVPDVVVGIDDTPPLATMTGAGSATEKQEASGDWATSTRDIVFTLDATDDAVLNSSGDRVNIDPRSGINSISCTETDPSNPGDKAFTATFPCTNGENHYTLATPGDGPKTITATIFDAAGNNTDPSVSTPVLTFNYDTTPPQDARIVHVPAADGRNGWYKTVPPIDIGVPDDAPNADGSPGSGSPPSPKYQYRFDKGAAEDCVVNFLQDPNHDGSVCRALDFPSSGQHQISFAAKDLVGNQLPDGEWHANTFKVDAVAPQSFLTTVPQHTDGLAGWFVTDPLIVLSGIDNPGGSGLANPPGGDGTAGFYYQVMPPSSSPTEVHYSGPFRLGPGPHTLCWRGQDAAGNSDVAASGGGVPIPADYPANHCFSYQVDTADPVATLSVAPATPNGGGGWYTTAPSMTLAASDPTPGSGLATPSLFVAEDGGSFAPYSGAITFGHGRHTLLYYAVDQAGRTSPVAERDFLVDLKAPTVTADVLPPAPALAPWWRRTATVAVTATDGGDDNSGVSSIEVAVGTGPWRPYTGPFPIGNGTHTVAYRATDIAGHTTTPQPLMLAVDDGMPTALAGSPSPAVWSPGDPASATLPFQVGDDLSHHLTVKVDVLDARGQVVRTLNAGSVTVAPSGSLTAGTVNWDGKNSSGQPVQLGLFTYRVIATDEAGNISEGGESQPIQIVLPRLDIPFLFNIHIIIVLTG